MRMQLKDNEFRNVRNRLISERVCLEGQHAGERPKALAGPANELKITFIGEAGIDTRALRKEFLSGK